MASAQSSREPKHRLPDRLAAQMIAHRWTLLGVAILLVGLAYPQASRLDFDRSIENMFAPDDPLLVPYRTLKRTFGGNEIALAAYVDPALLTPEGMQRVAELTDQMSQVDGVQSVISLNTTPLGTALIDSPLCDAFLTLFQGYTIGADRQTTAIVCMLRPEEPIPGAEGPDAVSGMAAARRAGSAASEQPPATTAASAPPAAGSQAADSPDAVAPAPAPAAAPPDDSRASLALSEDAATRLDRAATVAELKRLIEAHDVTGVLTGEPVMVVQGFGYIEDDGALLGRTSTALLMLTIILCFRSLRWVIVPVAVVNTTLILTQGLLVSAQFRLSMVSSMLWAIVTVTGTAMVIHVIVRFRDARSTGIAPREALLVTLAALSVPIAWTCLTDAAGFASLLAARVGPVHDFGMMMMIGSLVVIAAAALALPGLALAGRVDVDPKRAWGEGNLDHGLHQVANVTERFPRTLGLLTLLVVIVAAVGYRWIEVETDFTKNFRSSTPIVRSYEFVESRLGGAGVWDVLVPAPPVLDDDFLDRVRRLEARLRNEVRIADEQGALVPGLSKVLTVTDAIDAMQVEALGGLIGTDFMLRQFRQQMPVIMSSLFGEDPLRPGRHYLRIMLRAHERQPSDQKRVLIDEVTRISREEFPEAEVTGFFILLTDLIDSMVRDQWFTFTIAMLAIGTLMLVAFRSPTLALAALVPNALPIVVITGLMGWLGVRINMGAAMIAAVSLGLSIDSSIHYITHFLRLRRAGIPLHESIQLVHQHVGRAMVFSTLALIVGFSALTLSQFVPTIYFGILVGLSMLGGLVGNLVVLPVLLHAIYGRTDVPAPSAPPA